MRVLLIVDALFGLHERVMIERTVVGLLDDGFEVRVLVPEGMEKVARKWGTPVPLSTYVELGLPVLLPARVRSLINALDKEGEGSWDIVHAYGGKTWSFASELSKQLGSGLVLEFWRIGLAGRASSMTRVPGQRVMCSLSDPALKEALDEGGVRIPSRTCAWGVLAPVEPRGITLDGPLSVLFHSSGRDKDACAKAFDGVMEVLGGREGTHVFVNTEASERAGLWSRANGHGVLDQITLVDRIEMQRDLALQCDVYVNPDPAIEQRSMILEALASGIVVFASDQQRCSALLDSKTCVLVTSHKQSAWAAAIRDAVEHPDQALGRARSAWSYMREHRKVSSYIGALTDMYAEMVAMGEGV